MCERRWDGENTHAWNSRFSLGNLYSRGSMLTVRLFRAFKALKVQWNRTSSG